MVSSRFAWTAASLLLLNGACDGISFKNPQRRHRGVVGISSGAEEAPNDAATASRVAGLGAPKIVQPWRAKHVHSLFKADDPECECVGHGLPEVSGNLIDAPGTLTGNGPYVKRVSEDGEVSYLPAAYGGSCKAWEMELDEACKSSYPPAYCAQKWCYVSEKCKVKDVKQSLYFPEKPLHYSYNNCGSFDAFTSQACLTKGSPQACADPCAWNNGVCQNKLCQCTGDNKLSGAKALKFGNAYGEKCGAWDQKDCTKFEDKSSLGLWCCKRWCYVEESCPSAKPSAVAKGLFYSYYACPDVADEIRQCPWKKPVDFSGELLPLTPEARKALAENRRSSAQAGKALGPLAVLLLASSGLLRL